MFLLSFVFLSVLLILVSVTTFIVFGVIFRFVIVTLIAFFVALASPLLGSVFFSLSILHSLLHLSG